MRERLTEAMPTLSHLFGLSPSDIYALSLEEYQAYSAAAVEYAEANS
jgi:hypothetical protein